MSKERPIIFSADMVNAILAGNKTQTRRVIKPQPNGTWARDENTGCHKMYPLDENMDGIPWWNIGGINGLPKCKYGTIGDKLWVRETWRTYASLDDISPCNIVTGDGIKYEALGTNLPNDKGDYLFGMGKCRPSIFMPRWASRILLEITDIRVERLNDISESDARNEGIIVGGCLNCGESEPCKCDNPLPDARDSFINLWERINGESSWSQNQFVWVISFKRV